MALHSAVYTILGLKTANIDHTKRQNLLNCVVLDRKEEKSWREGRIVGESLIGSGKGLQTSILGKHVPAYI
jgi:hypothetical protein